MMQASGAGREACVGDAGERALSPADLVAGENAAARRFAARVAQEVGADRFSRYFDRQAVIREERGSIHVLVANKTLEGLIEKRFGSTLRRVAMEARAAVASGAAGQEPGGVLVRVAPELFEAEPVAPELPAVGTGGRADMGTGGASTVHAPALRRSGWTGARNVPLDRYRLESFVVGESNRLAYNAAVQMADGGLGEGGKGVGPLFIHGACGMGKTHLLQGIALRFKERHPGAIVRVTSGEAFLNDFVAAIRSQPTGTGGGNGVERFRRSYRRVDLLCIDDVHFLASKQSTQAELLHTFDEIERGGARVVLVSDESPRLLRKFSPALVSRFMAGMVAGLGAPDAGLRAQLIRTFASGRGLVFDDAAVELLVERTSALARGGTSEGGKSGAPNVCVRDIEGIITKIEALHRLMPEYGSANGRIGVLAVERALDGEGAGEGAAEAAGGYAGGRAAKPVRLEHIISVTCEALAVDARDLSGKTRHKRVVLARSLITHLSRLLTTMSYPEIARGLGRPNHSTVITAHQRLAKQLAVDEPVEVPGAPEVRTLGSLSRQLVSAIQRQAARRVALV